MATRLRKNRKHVRRAAGAFLILFVVLLVLLIAVSQYRSKPADVHEIQAILWEAQEDKTARATAFERARKAVPTNAIVNTGRDFASFLKRGSDSPNSKEQRVA